MKRLQHITNVVKVQIVFYSADYWLVSVKVPVVFSQFPK